MTYKKDERGEYRVPDTWIDAWTGEHGFPGYCLCELREYADGKSRVWRSEAHYLNDHPQDSLAHGIYLRTRDHLWQHARAPGVKAVDDTQRLERIRKRLEWDGYGYWLPELCVKSRELGQGQDFLPEPTLAELRAALDEAHADVSGVMASQLPNREDVQFLIDLSTKDTTSAFERRTLIRIAVALTRGVPGLHTDQGEKR